MIMKYNIYVYIYVNICVDDINVYVYMCRWYKCICTYREFLKEGERERWSKYNEMLTVRNLGKGNMGALWIVVQIWNNFKIV